MRTHTTEVIIAAQQPQRLPAQWGQEKNWTLVWVTALSGATLQNTN